MIFSKELLLDALYVAINVRTIKEKDMEYYTPSAYLLNLEELRQYISSLDDEHFVVIN